MTSLPDLMTGDIVLLIGPRAEREAMGKLTAALALQGPVRILDVGNSFDAYQVARLIRRHTTRLNETLNRILVARAFTCYQVVRLFEETPPVTSPHLVLDLLTTFCDESVTLTESYRLLRLVSVHLHRLRRQAPVVVSIRPPPQAERAGLIEVLTEVADHILIRESPSEFTPLKLF